MTLLGGRWRFIVLRSQRTLTGEAMDTKSGVMFLLQCIYRQDKPWRTIFNRRKIWCDQISTKSLGIVWTAMFWWFADQCQYRSILLLGAERKIPIATKIFGFQSRYPWNFREAMIFVILLILSTLVGNHLSKSVREESSVSNGLTDQWTDDVDLLGYYKEIYTGLSQKNRSEYGRQES